MAELAWGSVADWAQAVSSTVVLYLILLQMRQTTKQMNQQDDSERYNRSWEFVKFYREELRQVSIDRAVITSCGHSEPLKLDSESEEFKRLVKDFYQPRVHLFMLLNQLLQQQQVDERVLFNYLEDDFNSFVEIGIRASSAEEFRTNMSGKIKLLLSLWGTLIKANKVLYAAAPAMTVKL